MYVYKKQKEEKTSVSYFILDFARFVPSLNLTFRFSLHTMVFKWGQSAALLEYEFLVLRVGDIHFLIDEEIRVPLCPIR